MAKKKPKKQKRKALVKTKGKVEKKKCTARTKKCRDCGHRYEAGDKGWNCPNCGEDRKCTNDAIYPYNVCRMHGAGGGRPPIHGKFSIPSKIADRFNAIRQDPELMSLAYNIALSETRTDELLQKVHDTDTSAVHHEVISAVRSMEFEVAKLKVWLDSADVKDKVPDSKFAAIFNGVAALKDAIDPAQVEAKLWREITFHLDLTRRLNDTERKWATAHDQMIPISIAFDAIRTVMRDALEFITAPRDRKKFATRIKGYMGE
jgi:hypothetical protein